MEGEATLGSGSTRGARVTYDRVRACPATCRVRCRSVPPFRYRMTDAATGADLGPFVSKRGDWRPGERLGRSKGEDMVVTAVIQPEDDLGFRAYLVVRPDETLERE